MPVSTRRQWRRSCMAREKAATEAVHTPLALATFKPRTVRLRTRKTGFRPLTSPRATKAALLQNVCPPICWLSCKTRRATPSFAYFTSMPIAWPEPGAEKPLFSSGCDGGAQKEPHPPGYAYRWGRRVKLYRTRSTTVTHNSAARLPQPSHDSWRRTFIPRLLQLQNRIQRLRHLHRVRKENIAKDILTHFISEARFKNLQIVRTPRCLTVIDRGSTYQLLLWRFESPMVRHAACACSSAAVVPVHILRVPYRRT